MHRSLYVSDILRLVFEDTSLGKETLASLARTCHLFNSVALDVLWHDLYDFDPLLKLIPIVGPTPSSADHERWLTFHKYARRVKTLDGYQTQFSASAKKGLLNSLRCCPKIYLPLLPNVSKVMWSISTSRADSGIWLLKYLASPAITAVTVSLGSLRYPSEEMDVLAELPRICPSVTSFTLDLNSLCEWTSDASQEVGRLISQWQNLRTVRTSLITQPVMAQLTAQDGAIETLHIDYFGSSPDWNGRIPSSIRNLSLAVDCPFTCVRFFETVYASPVTLHLLVDMGDGRDEPGETDLEDMFSILPRHLDTSRLLSLAIMPTESSYVWRIPVLSKSMASDIQQFTALRELDLDYICTAHMSNMDYAHLAESLVHLQSLKLATETGAIIGEQPAATVEAVITVLTHCEHLRTLHMVFNGTIPPQRSILRDGSKARLSEEGRAWGVSNKRITMLRVGYSPIEDATVHAVASCFRSIMPYLVEIECKEKLWKTVQKLLGSR